MFNKRMKLFQEHWCKHVTDLSDEAEGLLEWFQVQENHEPSQLASGDIQERQNTILTVYNILESQLPFLLNQPASSKLLYEVKSVLDMLQKAMIEENLSAEQRIPSVLASGKDLVSIGDIVKNTVMTTHDVSMVLSLSYSSFINQILDQPFDAKRYAYIVLLREFMVDIQKQRIYNFRYLSEVADDLHNIPGFMASDFKLFDDDIFWKSIFNKRTEATRYIVKTFLSGLSGYYRWLRGIRRSNDIKHTKVL